MTRALLGALLAAFESPPEDGEAPPGAPGTEAPAIEAPATEPPGPRDDLPTTIELVPPEAPAPEPAPAPAPEPAPEPAPAPASVPGPATSQPMPGPARREPRLLETMQQFRAEEVAWVGNRRDDFRFVPGIQIRNQVGWVSAYQLDREGNRWNEGVLDMGRVRLNPRFQFGTRQNIEIVTQIDAVRGRWAPEGSSDPAVQDVIDPPADNRVALGQPPEGHTLRFVDPRHLYLQWTSSIGQLRLGQMGFTWGLGILANDGNNVDRFGDLKFGDDGPGDIYERILFGTRPFSSLGPAGRAWVLAIGGDLIYRDEHTELLQDRDRDGRLKVGDLGGQAIFVLRWQPEATPWNWVGAYAVYRTQRNADDRDVYPNDGRLEVGAGDVAGQGVHWLRDDLQLIGGFEGALIGGRTTWARNENGTHRVLQGGAAARAYLGDAEKWLVGFDAGYASGDRNPSDQWITGFAFDAGHTAGLVLFQQVLAWRTARSEILATNGELSGVPLNGTQFIPSRGSVTNALYVHPKARWGFRERFEVWGGPLIAAAPVPIADPYATRLGGGTPTNSVMGDGNKRYYGTELDLGVRARFDLRNLWLQAGVQGGLLLPGAGLANEVGDNESVVGALWLRTEIRY
jgi:hypothetical protein